ncbi:hypothetical protein PybrP1_005735 [[Pythium] brassicae (nom. inval.)]|nr:hypothetical protein PybrP1_005735 [[Pythium] brassicae (nom. inval.)]
MTVGISDPQVFAKEPVHVTWNATLNLDSSAKLRKNKFGMDQLYAALDKASQQRVQIIYSRLQTCVFGADCDPVGPAGPSLSSSSNAPTNFSDNRALFASSELVFSEAGSYALVGHIVLPGADATKRRYEFAAFTKVDVVRRPVQTSTAPLAETQTESKSQGIKTEVLCVIIIGAIAGVSLVVIGFTTLRSKGKPLAATKKDFRDRRLDTNADVPTVLVDGVNDDDNFAMLSMNEVTMSSDRPRANTFLASLARGQGSKAKPMPVGYVGPLCEQSFQRNAVPIDTGSQCKDDHRALTLETPMTSRDQLGDYSAYDDQSRRLKPTSHIMFNDIEEDEVCDEPNSWRRPAADLTEVSQRIREHANQMMLELQEVESGSKRTAPKMTADDLRATVKVEKGPELTLSDLGSVQQGLYRYSEDSDYD